MMSQPLGAPRRACILVGGGDAPGVNAIVRAFVHATHRMGIEVVGSRYGFEGLLAQDGLVPIGLEHVRGILPKGGCVLGCSTRINPFYVARDGKTENMGPAIVDRLKSIGIEALVMIGGDGTLLAAETFTSFGMPCIVISKTIDNDVAGTELTCGFHSAVDTATHAIDALHATAEAHARVMLVEVMGRNAGFIALAAGVAGGADVILVPEIPYVVDRVVDKIRERESLGMRFTIVVVAEGARPVGGEPLVVNHGRPGHLPRLGGAGDRLKEQLDACAIGHEVRITVLGHLQRGGSPAALDRALGTQMGTFAAELFARRDFKTRVVVRDGRVVQAPLAALGAELHKFIDRGENLVRAARLVGISFGDDAAPS
jgi:6-phosphofructokinase 1